MESLQKKLKINSTQGFIERLLSSHPKTENDISLVNMNYFPKNSYEFNKLESQLLNLIEYKKI